MIESVAPEIETVPAKHPSPDSSPGQLITALPFHDEHDRLFNELHTRPFPVLATPLRISQFALLLDGLSLEDELQHLIKLCERHSVHPPAPGASCYYQDLGCFEFRWERHTEFSTYTFLMPADDTTPFHQVALGRVSPEWLSGLPGTILSGIHVEVQHAEAVPEDRERLRQSFEGQRLMSSQVIDSQAEMWTAYRLHSDGFLRFLVRNKSLNPCQTGRLVRSLLELETYRMMLLQGLPLAKTISPELRLMEQQLSRITSRIRKIEGLEDERAMLAELSDIAARTEALITQSRYRFYATKAYHALVLARLEELRESEQEGLMTLNEFLTRRISPAYRTGEAVRKSLDDMALRVDRASELLRTRVNLQIEAQNQRLLSSMNERSDRQLRLQQAVEGLSVAAITYYSVGLFKYLLDALGAYGVHLPKTEVLGVAVPVVLFGSWFGIRAFKKALGHR